MEKLISKQRWDTHTAYKHVYVEDNKIIGMFVVNIHDSNPVADFTGVWVTEEFRGKHISHEMMHDILAYNLPMSCEVHKDNWVHQLYEKYGFTYWEESSNANYYWMKNFETEYRINNCWNKNR